MEENLSEFLTELSMTLGVRLIFAAFILFVGIKLANKLLRRLEKLKSFQALEASFRSFARSFSKIALYILVIITAAYVLGVPMTSFMAILASAGLAIGLALQGSLSNLAGGIMILIFKPLRVGDLVEVGAYKGRVKEITIFYTFMVTFDGKQVTLPNSTVSNSMTVNLTATDKRRVELIFSVSYKADIEQVKKIIFDVASAHPKTTNEPKPPMARLLKLNDSSMDFQLRVWCKNKDYVTVRFDMNEQVKQALDANGIEIPFPQMDVHMR